MVILGQTYIGVKTKKQDYINLGLNVKSTASDWAKAIDMFKDRVNGRYFNIIDRLFQQNKFEENGFAIMALECLLIETLMQFKKGEDETTQGKNKKEYSRFLRDEFGQVFPTIKKAERFYSDIRCGILHSAQTKNGSQLTYGNAFVVEYRKDNRITVDIEKMVEVLRRYIEEYIKALRDERTIELRHNFIRKMNYICKVNQTTQIN